MSAYRHEHSLYSPATLLGLLLIVLGVLFLAGQYFRVDLGRMAWPFFVIVPGVVVLASAATNRSPGGLPLATVGSVTTTTGLILLYQNSTDHWESWAYAWALIAPGAVGLGLMLHGAVAGEPKRVREGRHAVAAGLGIFTVGFVFFELILGIGGFRFAPGASAWPLLLIGLGVFLLFREMTSRRIE